MSLDLRSNKVPLVATHSVKFSSPGARSSVPIGTLVADVHGVIGIHSIPLANRLIRAGDVAANVSAEQWISAAFAPAPQLANPSTTCGAILSGFLPEAITRVDIDPPKGMPADEKRAFESRRNMCKQLITIHAEVTAGKGSDAKTSCYLRKACLLGLMPAFVQDIESLFHLHNKESIQAVRETFSSTVYSSGEDAVDAFLPQIILPSSDGEDIAITPLAAPSVSGALIAAIRDARFDETAPRRVRSVRLLGYLSMLNAGCLAPAEMIKGDIFHSVPPVRDEDVAEEWCLDRNPGSWVRSSLHHLRRNPVFLAKWAALAAHLIEAVNQKPLTGREDSSCLPRWMRDRGDGLRNTIVAEVMNDICRASTFPDEAKVHEVLDLVLAELTKETGALNQVTRDWFTKEVL